MRIKKTGSDDPIIANYDPEAGLEEPKLAPGRPVCPTCLGKGRITTAQPELDGLGNLKRMITKQVPCPDCKV